MFLGFGRKNRPRRPGGGMPPSYPPGHPMANPYQDIPPYLLHPESAPQAVPRPRPHQPWVTGYSIPSRSSAPWMIAPTQPRETDMVKLRPWLEEPFLDPAFPQYVVSRVGHPSAVSTPTAIRMLVGYYGDRPRFGFKPVYAELYIANPPLCFARMMKILRDAHKAGDNGYGGDFQGSAPGGPQNQGYLEPPPQQPQQPQQAWGPAQPQPQPQSMQPQQAWGALPPPPQQPQSMQPQQGWGAAPPQPQPMHPQQAPGAGGPGPDAPPPYFEENDDGYGGGAVSRGGGHGGRGRGAGGRGRGRGRGGGGGNQFGLGHDDDSDFE